MAFRRLGVPFEVVDVGYDLEAERESMAQTLSREEPSSWSPDAVKHLFPPAVTSANGVEKRLAFGSDFPYRRPDFLSLTSEGCIIDVSHGKGGFGNVWGAATLPYAQHDVAGWPFPSSELAESYGNVLKFMPSSAERDRLHDVFPVYSNHSQALKRSEQTENLLRALDARHEGMKASGIQYGRARVAVDASTCRYCGECLDGCVYGSIFNPRTLWNQLEKEGVRIHKGYYALEFTEAADGVTLTAINVKD
jgi:ferredoxin